MLKFFRWLFGYVEFAFTGGFLDGFVNECYQQRVNIHDIKRGKNYVSATCLAREYKRLRPIAKSNGGRVKITKRKGALFVFLKLRSRTGLIAGALAFLLIFNLLSGYAWSIEITGNKTISASEIESFLAENGFGIGTRWRSVSLPNLENLVMATYEDIAWIHINRNGSKANIEIDEAEVPKEVDNESGRYNLKATKDGVVTYTNVKRGWDIVKVGSAVTKGDLLASGVYESEANKTNHFTHASGIVIAKVNEPISMKISRKQTKKKYTGESTKRAIIFFGLRLPLYLGKVLEDNCEVQRQYKFLRLNGVDLPIGIELAQCKSFVILDEELSDKQLKKLAELELEKKLNSELLDCEIIDRKVKISIEKDCAVVSGNVVALENIAEEIKL